MKTKTFWLLSLVLLLPSPASSQGTSSYVFSQAQFATGPLPYSVAVGDFNGDGILDLAIANADSTNGNTISILLGKPDGTFAPKVDYPTGAAPYFVVAADLNGDGNFDLAVAEPYGNVISVLLGNGDGTFQSHVDFAVGQGPRALAVGDFNRDGRLDVAVANQNDNTVSILLGNGDGTFQPPIPYAIGTTNPVSIAAADLNQDGKLDLAVAASGGMVTLQGNEDGTFQPPIFSPVHASGCSGPVFSIVGLVAADFDGDGRVDLAVAATWAATARGILFRYSWVTAMVLSGTPVVIHVRDLLSR